MKTYYLLTLLFLFAGCSNQPQAPKDSTLPILDLSKDYPLVKLDIHEIADVEYVPLETTDESVYTCISDWRISDKQTNRSPHCSAHYGREKSKQNACKTD